MRKITIPNPSLNNAEKTYLDADYSSGTTLTIVSNLGFADNYMVVVGGPGEEKTEAKDATGITGNTTINISGALKFSHNKSTPVYKSVWESVSIERQTGSAGAWAVVTVSEIDWDKKETIYIDVDGSDSHNYRFRFYNQFLVKYSEYSPTIAGSGFTRKQAGYMIQQVRKITKEFTSERVTDTDILRMFQAAHDIIGAIKDSWWFLKVDTFKALNGIATEADTSVYSLATYTDFNYLSRMRYNFNDGTDNHIYDLDFKVDLVFDDYAKDQDRTSDDEVQRFKLIPPDSSSSQGYFEVDPVPETTGYGTFYPEYYKIMGTIDDIADTTDCPLPQILEEYAAWQIEGYKGNDTKALLHQKQFYGPSPDDKNRKELSGIALLEHMDSRKGRVTGSPGSLYTRAGSASLRRRFSSRIIDRDSYAEKYF